ncbi:MAG: thermonuclease family protein [Parcubacteria group bacterium]|nr:thermonuclease family protein [Parcubacteria group bacterium]
MRLVSALFMIFLGGVVSLLKADNYDAKRVLRSVPAEPIVKTHAQPREENFLVTQVIDGDTIELENGVRVRYIGIDTPEIDWENKESPRNCQGLKALERNKQLVLNRRVRLKKDVSERDKYGRLLRYVYADGQLVNLELVKSGYAKTFAKSPDVRHKSLFKEAERLAKKSGIGIWGKCQR